MRPLYVLAKTKCIPSLIADEVVVAGSVFVIFYAPHVHSITKFCELLIFNFSYHFVVSG